MAKLSEAKRRGNAKWDKKHPDKKRVYRYRSYARKFIRDLANHDDLKELQQLIKQRLDNEDQQ